MAVILLGMSLLESRFEELKQELGELVEPTDRLEFFVDQAKSVEPLEAKYLNESFRVSGCISNLWIVPTLSEKGCRFACDGDALIPKGIAFTIIELFQDCDAEQILAFDKSKLNQLGISEILTPNRRNALANVFAVIKSFAESVVSQNDSLRVAAS